MAKTKWTKEKIIEVLEKHKAKFGKYPSSSILKGGDLPKHSAFKKQMGINYAEWLRRSGVKTLNSMDDKFKNMNVGELKDWFLIIAKERNYKSFWNHDKGVLDGEPGTNFLEKRFIKSNLMDEIHGLIKLQSLNFKLDEIEQNFLKYVEDGKKPPFSELDAALKNKIIAYYLTYTNFLEAIKNKKDLTKQIITFQKIEKTDRELLDDYYNLYLALGEAPKQSDINAQKNMAPYSHYQVRFGTINYVRKLLDIPYQNKAKYSKEFFVDELIKLYIENGCKRITVKELNKHYNFSTISRHFRETKISKVWEEVEEEYKKRNK